MYLFSNISSWFFVLFFAISLFTGCKTEDTSPENNFPAQKANSIFIDPQGVVWAGTDIGIVSYMNGIWKNYETLNFGEVDDLAGQTAGTSSQLWLATKIGAQLADYKSDEISTSALYTTNNSGLPDNIISVVIINPLNAIWFATPKGISFLNKNKWYSEDGSGDLQAHPVISMAFQSDGWIFAGTTGMGVGRFKYDSAVDGISGASYYTSDWSGLPSDTILCIYVDKSNRQWYGTPQGVAYHAAWETKKEWKTYSVKDGLINNRVQAITADTDGKMWFGTSSGISSFDGQNWKNYSVADGLGNPGVNDIAVDSKGAVWFATNGGISVLEGTKWKNFPK